MQISYHSALTKIQKLQNLKKKKKKKLFSVSADIVRNWPVQLVFFLVRNWGLYVPVCLSVRYIPTVPAGTVRIRLPLFTWHKRKFLFLFFNYFFIQDRISTLA